ncbi:MAG: sensor histidine kinase [Planctomycetota bacterium]
MIQDSESIEEAGLRFFGKMSASISHEIKNVLAIINEIGGLLEDLAVLAGRGRPVAPDRLETVGAKLKQQVQRADRIVKTMNAFSHSVDEKSQAVDLNDIVALVLTLAGRLASMRGVTLAPGPRGQAVSVTTAPFHLMHLVWLCLSHSMDAAGESRTVTITVTKRGRRGEVRFAPLQGLAKTGAAAFPGVEAQALLAALGAEIVSAALELALVVPVEAFPG